MEKFIACQQSITQDRNIHLVGIQVRTSYQNELNFLTARIGLLVQNYWLNGIAHKISNRTSPGCTYVAYHDYENKCIGDYTYFIGEEVSHFDDVPEDFIKLTIPKGQYAKLTTKSGPVLAIIMGAWHEISKYTTEDLGGTRSYNIDFEIYDERSKDPQNAVIDICIGINNK